MRQQQEAYMCIIPPKLANSTTPFSLRQSAWTQVTSVDLLTAVNWPCLCSGIVFYLSVLKVIDMVIKWHWLHLKHSQNSTAAAVVEVTKMILTMWTVSSEKVPSYMCKICRFKSSCTWAKYHPSLCSPFSLSVVSNDSNSGE